MTKYYWKKAKFFWLENEHKGIIILNSYDGIECNIELIEEDIALKIDSKKEEKPSVVINGKEYQVEKIIEEYIAKEDNINHPSHYQGKIECIDYLQDKLTAEEFRGFLKGNVLKYLSRAGKKYYDLEDCKKAQWYLNKLITTMEK